MLRAALDVYENEPEVHPGLIKSRKTVTIHAFIKSALEVLNNAQTLSPHCAVYNETIFEELPLPYGMRPRPGMCIHPSQREASFHGPLL